MNTFLFFPTERTIVEQETMPYGKILLLMKKDCQNQETQNTTTRHLWFTCKVMPVVVEKILEAFWTRAGWKCHVPFGLIILLKYYNGLPSFVKKPGQHAA